MAKRHTLPKTQKVEFSRQEERELKILREKVQKLCELKKSLELEYPGEKQITIGVTISMAVQKIAVLEGTRIEAEVGQEI